MCGVLGVALAGCAPDTGLDAAEIREQVRPYQERYDVPTENLR
jgi:hypothetical protein